MTAFPVDFVGDGGGKDWEDEACESKQCEVDPHLEILDSLSSLPPDQSITLNPKAPSPDEFSSAMTSNPPFKPQPSTPQLAQL